MSGLSSADVRKKFLSYFESHGHKVVESSPLVPRMDPTLLFTNAGMNQFKGVFTGQETRPYNRAATSQKCVRAGGKHNDLENVGYTARHHTFFEMLGNFSFGNYFKKEAIEYAWQFITQELKLSTDRLYVTVFREDDDAYDLWHKHIGLSADRISRLGEKDNFWAMGATGPCGPCSEIYYDQGPSLAGEKVGDDGERYLEFWNLVFMEFEQKQDGTRVKLPKPSIDTGMGLERISSILQGKLNNYDSDVFAPLINALLLKLGKSDFAALPESEKVSYRVIADHIRAMTFLISDGVIPSKDGRGYVLRRIMRRAIRHGRKLGFDNLFLTDLSQEVVKQMAEPYPELVKNKSIIQNVILLEEQQFSKTVDRGIALLNEEILQLKKNKSTTLKGDVAFHLYDTYGFPVDMTADILREQSLKLDEAGLEEAEEAHREKARGSWKGSSTTKLDDFIVRWLAEGVQTTFLGYDNLVSHGTILKMIVNGEVKENANTGDEVELISNQTPFYGESGGQVGDIGSISADDSHFVLEVLDTKKPAEKIIVHKCRVSDGTVHIGDEAIFSVDTSARAATAKNHTATHLLHATLIEVLGNHVRQKGSMVAPERLRFDFTHTKAVTAAELSSIERIINERIWKDSPLTKNVLPLEEALKSGAMALFDEKYGNQVRVVAIDQYSKELCGGTHLERTGEIGIFKILKETSVAAGIRRIEAFTGYRALRYIEDMDKTLRTLSATLGVSSDKLESRIDSILKQQKESKKKPQVQANIGSLASVEKIGTASFVKLVMEGIDPKNLREYADRELEKVKDGVVVVASQDTEKVYVVVKVSKGLTDKMSASVLVQVGAKILEGSGGGRPDMAQAGGVRKDRLDEALASIREKVAQSLGS